MVAARQQSQTLRRLVEQFGLRQNAAADRHHGIGGKDVGAAQFVVELDVIERHLGLGLGQPVGIGARDLAALGRLVDIRGLERIRFDAGLIDQGEPARRA